MAVETERIRKLNDRPFRDPARYVLYWAQMNRRVESNHGLLYAIELANRKGLPVLYYEGLTCSYPSANDRLHTFILEGVPDTARRLKKLGIGYVFHLRRRQSDPNDALYQLARDAAAVVTDDYPTFIAREHNRRVPQKLDTPYYVVDSSCIVPMSTMTKREYGAYTIRPKIKKVLAQYLKPADAIRVKHKYEVESQHPLHTEVAKDKIAELVASCEINHSLAPSPSFAGGRDAAERRMDFFLDHNLRRYARERNEPGARATSGMSPYLHFGHISSLEIALSVKDYADEHKLVAEEFLEELIVRRELAFNYARFVDRPDRLEDLPDWVQQIMRQHASDRRDPLYTRQQLEQAETYDELWNATQKEMRLRGKIHGYYRMYWGKKILEWSATYQEAVDTMVAIHDRYALDGRDPNTYTGILWCFGLHDRPWFDRPIFGAIRYMSLEGMKRKTNTRAYLDEIAYLERTGKDPHRIA
jgi:deoxyribodipyrimidine photo-lyase